MRTVSETCRPRPDVLAGGLEDRDFAAKLDKVVQGDPAYEAYTDAARLFDLTYPTSGLRELIEALYGAELEWQELAGKLTCRVVKYLEDVDIFEEHRWDEYRTWVIDRHTRLRHAIDELGGAARAVGEG